MATHSSILAWRIPWTEEPGGLQSMGWQRVGHDSAAKTHTHTHIMILTLLPHANLGKPESHFRNVHLGLHSLPKEDGNGLAEGHDPRVAGMGSWCLSPFLLAHSAP